MSNYDFDGLFILDLANNHQGDVEHAKRIIKEVGKVINELGVRAALKFQFRNLDTLVHPDFRNREDIKHIPRFLSTALSEEQYGELAEEVRKQGLITMATPFDEDSVDMLTRLDIEIIKVASCSAADYPLLQRVVDAGRPVVVSTGGLVLRKIDRLVSLMEQSVAPFALMHCVALYPTQPERLNLNQIARLRERFPNIPIGFSTHEEPENLDAVKVAYAKGASLFERHVGMTSKAYTLNAYSSTPEQIRTWIQAYREAKDMCGGEDPVPASTEETASLETLMRGVFASRDISEGEEIARDAVFFAMPLQQGQLTSSTWRKGMMADKDYAANEPLNERLATYEISKEERIYRVMLQVNGMLNQARIFFEPNSSVEFSHHYGFERFREFGCVIIDCVNRKYCKKLIVLLPRQKHPYHYHAKKEETFQLLSGDIEIVLDGHRKKLALGETCLVEAEQWHKFHTLDGAIVEEVSTTHYNNDSFYEDERIAKIPREKRKTIVSDWTAFE